MPDLRKFSKYMKDSLDELKSALGGERKSSKKTKATKKNKLAA